MNYLLSQTIYLRVKCQRCLAASRIPKTLSVLVVFASQQLRVQSPFTLKDHVCSVATETSEDKIASLNPVTDVKKNTHIVSDKSEKDETLSNQSSEHFSAEFELGKKGSCCHVRTRFKSKTLAKYAATALGGLLAGLLL